MKKDYIAAATSERYTSNELVLRVSENGECRDVLKKYDADVSFNKNKFGKKTKLDGKTYVILDIFMEEGRVVMTVTDPETAAPILEKAERERAEKEAAEKMAAEAAEAKKPKKTAEWDDEEDSPEVDPYSRTLVSEENETDTRSAEPIFEEHEETA